MDTRSGNNGEAVGKSTSESGGSDKMAISNLIWPPPLPTVHEPRISPPGFRYFRNEGPIRLRSITSSELRKVARYHSGPHQYQFSVLAPHEKPGPLPVPTISSPRHLVPDSAYILATVSAHLKYVNDKRPAKSTASTAIHERQAPYNFRPRGQAESTASTAIHERQAHYNFRPHGQAESTASTAIHERQAHYNFGSHGQAESTAPATTHHYQAHSPDFVSDGPTTTEQQLEASTAAVAEGHPPAQEQSLPPNTHGYIRPAVTSYICFRVYYEKCLRFMPRHTNVLKAISKLWRGDPFKSHWAIIAQAFTLARDVVGTKAARLRDFVALAATLLNLPSPQRYLRDLGWVGTETRRNRIRFVQDSKKVDHAKFIWNRESKILSNNIHQIPVMDLDLLNACLARGYLEGRHMQVLVRIAVQYSTVSTLGPSRIRSLVEREEATEEAARRRRRRASGRVPNQGSQRRAQRRRRFDVRFVHLSAQDITTGRTSAYTAHGLDTTHSLASAHVAPAAPAPVVVRLIQGRSSAGYDGTQPEMVFTEEQRQAMSHPNFIGGLFVVNPELNPWARR
nr:putative mating-type 1-1-1 protein [Ceratocystis cacaofunesta]WRK64968.1 putative mating-type 1-1-1 protein [Ceratocystis cacaofunesta]